MGLLKASERPLTINEMVDLAGRWITPEAASRAALTRREVERRYHDKVGRVHKTSRASTDPSYLVMLGKRLLVDGCVRSMVNNGYARRVGKIDKETLYERTEQKQKNPKACGYRNNHAFSMAEVKE